MIGADGKSQWEREPAKNNSYPQEVVTEAHFTENVFSLGTNALVRSRNGEASSRFNLLPKASRGW